MTSSEWPRSLLNKIDLQIRDRKLDWNRFTSPTRTVNFRLRTIGGYRLLANIKALLIFNLTTSIRFLILFSLLQFRAHFPIPSKITKHARSYKVTNPQHCRERINIAIVKLRADFNQGSVNKHCKLVVLNDKSNQIEWNLANERPLLEYLIIVQKAQKSAQNDKISATISCATS